MTTCISCRHWRADTHGRVRCPFAGVTDRAALPYLPACEHHEPAADALNPAWAPAPAEAWPWNMDKQNRRTNQ